LDQKKQAYAKNTICAQFFYYPQPGYFHRMPDPHIQNLLRCIELEAQEELERFRLDEQHSLKSLKAAGLALHPLRVTRRGFGYADYPEFSFRLPYPAETVQFRDGCAIECFRTGEEPVKGILLSLDGNNGECRLFAPDFPDWLEEDGVGIKRSPDQRTTTIMRQVLQQLEANKDQYALFQQLHGAAPVETTDSGNTIPVPAIDPSLNASQQSAVKGILENRQLTIVHGPPGTGKTTTLVEAIRMLTEAGEKVLVSAPSNTAVDHIARGLLDKKIRILRVGNISKTHPDIFAHTPEGRMTGSAEQKEIKQLKIRAAEFRKMANKYKRHFGAEEREQRRLLLQEVKQIRAHIRQLEAYHEEKLRTDAQVILGTPIGLYDAEINRMHFHTLVMDEAGQCIEPLAWCIFPLADRYVLAGDPFQLPPTVLSDEAARLGFNRSLLEVAMHSGYPVHLLTVQYRMPSVIAGYSSGYFYEGKLETAPHLLQRPGSLVFIDTAGTGFSETAGQDGNSLQNEGELQLVQQLLEQNSLPPDQTALITPYAGQAEAARGLLGKDIRISTIDSFQGQETGHVLVSLVRSNEEGIIGFLKDYRRMNVAITRAQQQLTVIGDSATIGNDPFFRAFLDYVEQQGQYRSAWEFDIFT